MLSVKTRDLTGLAYLLGTCRGLKSKPEPTLDSQRSLYFSLQLVTSVQLFDFVLFSDPS